MKKLVGLVLVMGLVYCGLAHARVSPILVVEAQLQPVANTPVVPFLGNVGCTVSYRGSNYSMFGYWSNDPATLGKVVLPFEFGPLVAGQPAVVSCRGVYLDVFYRPIIVTGTAMAAPGRPAPVVVIPMR